MANFNFGDVLPCLRAGNVASRKSFGDGVVALRVRASGGNGSGGMGRLVMLRPGLPDEDYALTNADALAEDWTVEAQPPLPAPVPVSTNFGGQPE